MSHSILLSGLLLVLSHCQPFVGGSLLAGTATASARRCSTHNHLALMSRPCIKTRAGSLRVSPHHPHHHHTSRLSRPFIKIRGGSLANESSPIDGTALQASPRDYSEVARSLFGNFIPPATLLITGLVPLMTQQITLSKRETKNSLKRKLRGLYYLMTLLATCSELICIIYASIACSRLLEYTAPATSAFALIERDFELPWVATTVHFIGGLMGFIVASGLGAYLSFPKRYNAAGASFAAASLLWVTRLANTRALAYSNAPANCMHLMKRYIVLAIQQLKSSRPSTLGIASVALTVLSIILTIRALVSSDDE